VATGGRLAALRKQAGLSQLQPADRVEFRQSQIHRYASGTSEPSLDALCSAG
jgi:transcriptional regulator with XRE-family HTH domain